MNYIVAYIGGTGYTVMELNSQYGYYEFFAKSDRRYAAEKIAEALNG